MKRREGNRWSGEELERRIGAVRNVLQRRARIVDLLHRNSPCGTGFLIFYSAPDSAILKFISKYCRRRVPSNFKTFGELCNSMSARLTDMCELLQSVDSGAEVTQAVEEANSVLVSSSLEYYRGLYGKSRATQKLEPSEDCCDSDRRHYYASAAHGMYYLAVFNAMNRVVSDASSFSFIATSVQNELLHARNEESFSSSTQDDSTTTRRCFKKRRLSISLFDDLPITDQNSCLSDRRCESSTTPTILDDAESLAQICSSVADVLDSRWSSASSRDIETLRRASKIFSLADRRFFTSSREYGSASLDLDLDKAFADVEDVCSRNASTLRRSLKLRAALKTLLNR